MEIKELFPNNSWRPLLESQFNQPYWDRLEYHLNSEGADTWFPGPMQIFKAFKLTPPENVKVVILGQDPYQRPGLANGLAFSVNAGLPHNRFPPSLKNIFKEAGIEKPVSGDLSSWAEQGVLLLNTALTVSNGVARSHLELWQPFTDYVIDVLAAYCPDAKFMLWGSVAIAKVTNNKTAVYTAAHPCRASAHRGFFGCGHFEATKDIINWRSVE